MRWLTVRILIAALGLAVVATTADAQRRVRRGRRAVPVTNVTRVGGHLGYASDVKEAVLGVQATFPVTAEAAFYPSFDYYFVDPGSLWSVNGDLKYRPPTRYGFWYVGGGLNISHTSAGGGNTDGNLNLLTGIEGRRGQIRPFAEARWVVGEWVQLVGGVSWVLR